MTSDRAAANYSCGRLLDRSLKSRDLFLFSATNQHVGCIAHIIHLAVQDFLKSFRAERTEESQLDVADADLTEIRDGLVDENGGVQLMSLAKKVSEIFVHVHILEYTNVACLQDSNNLC